MLLLEELLQQCLLLLQRLVQLRREGPRRQRALLFSQLSLLLPVLVQQRPRGQRGGCPRVPLVLRAGLPPCCWARRPPRLRERYRAGIASSLQVVLDLLERLGLIVVEMCLGDKSGERGAGWPRGDVCGGGLQVGYRTETP